ncbi:glycosyltransferase family 9 protein [Streptosporangium sp. NPDC002721]|uniref:glycosyltransferase family 9 protein n=1 Tax=Streptosporangium sp. NPDC002721 TaxID=3366188 RepID=UPI0036980837
MTAATAGTVLVARLDNAGDVLLAGPAIRAVAHAAREVVLMVGPHGRAAGELLPGVSRVVEWRTPWIDPEPSPMTGAHALRLLRILRRTAPEQALILTSFHQSPLPLALLLRLAGTPRIAAICGDHAGSLLDVRHVVDETVDVPEAERMLALVRAAGFDLPPGDGGALAVRRPLPETGPLTGPPGYVVVHPGVSAQARAWPVESWTGAVRDLVRAGRRVVVTGGRGERALTARVAGTDAHDLGERNAGKYAHDLGGTHAGTDARDLGRTHAGTDAHDLDGRVAGPQVPGTGGRGAGPHVIDLGGKTSFAQLAAVLAGACAVVVANTGPAHLAAAVGTPVVSLFAPVVPAVRWAPYGVSTVLLGDQRAACRGSRARECPVPDHPCLSSVNSERVVEAVDRLTSVREVVR